MRFSLVTLTACLLLAHQAVMASPVPETEDPGDFCIYFYKKPNQVDQAGFICGGGMDNPGDRAGRPNANMPVVASLTAPDWLQVTLFNKKAYAGTSKIFQGNEDEISPAFNVQSLRYERK
ncbi:hypothetical protein [Absidia glauca]|uniref:Uncharacterized protein n=1 Tax=Absidia glauca TaxID=4829 RepID=A0A168KUI3_ABSGL|nr:hypothetical protein [Absidia glauca]